MRVQTGCRDCKRCNNSAAAEAGRKLGKLTANVMTMGSVAAVQAFTGNCRACGHKKSLHGVTGEALPVEVVTPVPAQEPVPVPPPTPVTPSPGWYPSPNQPGQLQWWDGAQWTPSYSPAN
ncbi:DUF2510 domain-containing protein [Amycolatopsis jejuensis]|uniref:DUF2510 domain-containing protein n=1 Tax=Amycolatopsis jejuensis TaxID=330084 RepID=UPI000B06AA33|nr:DUF2510 domain-containing protein [Amycolatopsis jejuensis]